MATLDFLELKSSQMNEKFFTNYSKKDLEKEANEAATFLMDSGEMSAEEMLSQVTRMKLFVDTLEARFRKEVEEKIVTPVMCNGIQMTPQEGRRMLCYEDDVKYRQLKAMLKDREEQIKLATMGSVIFDGDGVQVEAVPVKYSKTSIKLNF